MDCSLKDEDTATKHIIDYYKKYSQNRELPKYFSGTSVSYLPEIKDVDSPDAEIKTLVKTDISIVVTNEEVYEKNKNLDEPTDTSRASSVLSNRKLEWDNGADIGYNTCQEKCLRKTLSLPEITDLMQKKSAISSTPTASKISIQKSHSSSSDGNVKIVLLDCSSSSDSHSDGNMNSEFSKVKKKKISSSSSSNAFDGSPKNIVPSSSSSDSCYQQSLKDFASTLSYLKQKIGIPGAHSTPKYFEGQAGTNVGLGTPVSCNTVSDVECKARTSKKCLPQVEEKTNVKRLSTKSNILLSPSTNQEEKTLKNSPDIEKPIQQFENKIVNLAVTKPITIECICNCQILNHKSLQTITEQCTVGVQTDKISEKELNQIIRKNQGDVNNQSVIYFDYSESDKSNACSTQTTSDIIESHCESFEYLKQHSLESGKSNIPQNVNNIEKSDKIGSAFPESEHVTNLKRSQKTNDLRTNPSEENSEKSSSKDCCLGNLISTSLLDMEDDIGKSIYLLQRLLKSKKYDQVTKKHYIKKIIKKITESKYLEESSTSSDLFVPKKLEKKVNGFTGDKNEKNHLHSNIPWYPAAGEQIKLSPRRKKLVQKTFTQDFLPEQQSLKDEVSSAPEIVPVNSRDTRKNRFTLTNNNHKYEGSTDKTHSEKMSPESNSISLEKHYESSSIGSSYQNWRDEKTKSEKILEKHFEDKSHSSNGNGDCFVEVADRERQFQIRWIDNEISHLGKLKGLLEKPTKTHPKNKNPPNIKKTTNIYTVSSKNNADSKMKRNYIIETLLGVQSSSEINFKLNGQVYTVQEYLNSKRQMPERQVTGNIEVVSSDNTTNIKVTTFCETCKRSPCICLFHDDCNCEPGENCGSETCVCRNNSQEKFKSMIPSKDTVHWDYRKSAFPSVNNSSSGSFDDCICCKKYPCSCDAEFKILRKTNSKNEMAGTFIPIRAKRPEVKYSTYPSTSKEDYGSKLNLKSFVGYPKCEKSVQSVTSEKHLNPSSDSLKNVFENCVCTQSKCTCNFVERLVNCFAKPDIPASVVCDNKCLQTEIYPCNCEVETIGLQTHVDMQNQDQQTSVLGVRDKCLQTENEFDHRSATMQTRIMTDNQIQQTAVLNIDEKTETVNGNFNGIGVQTKANIKYQQNVKEKTQVKGVTFQNVYDENKYDDSLKGVPTTLGRGNLENASTATIFSVESSEDILHKSVIAHSVGSLVDDTVEQKNILKYDGTSRPHSASLPVDYIKGHSQPPVHSFNQINRQDEATSSTSSDSDKRKWNVPASPIIHSVGTSPEKIKKQHASQTIVEKSTSSDKSRTTTSSKSSSSSQEQRKIICVCCCTQTEPESHGKDRKHRVKDHVKSSETDSKKSKQKKKRLTISSTVYEICPSILVSSYNDTSQSISEPSTSKSLVVICVCCKEEYPMSKISMLGNRNESYPLCCNCLAQKPILTSVCYAGPEENCPCSKPSRHEALKTDGSEETKKTTDSNDIDEYCTCTKPFQFKKSKYCSYCQYKLRNTLRSKNGIAYSLTLETDCLNKIRKRRRRIPLEEIRLKVPCPSTKKKHKDKENVSRRESEKEEKKCICGRVICTSNCYVNGISSKQKKISNKNTLTLQEYLKKNRPDFIESAETRRQILLNSKSEREIDRTDAKIKFAEDTVVKNDLKKPRKLFTEQEMKKITERNYKKLPEVKQKINSIKEQRLRTADRFIMDIFAKNCGLIPFNTQLKRSTKIQHSVLKGRKSFPIDSNVICLPKICNC